MESGSVSRHMTPCACHCAACGAAGHGNTCVVLVMGLHRMFDSMADDGRSNADVVDLVLQHYRGGASGWDTLPASDATWQFCHNFTVTW